MRKVLLVVILLPLLAVGYCSLPLSSVAMLSVTVTDQHGNPINSDASASYLDAAGQVIATITSGSPSSWRNNLHWWAHSHHGTSTHRPADAKRAVTLEVTAKGCSTVRLPVVLEWGYEPMSLAPHGGGSAHFLYRYDRSVSLDCG